MLFVTQLWYNLSRNMKEEEVDSFHRTIIVYYYLEGISFPALIIYKEWNQTRILTGFIRECRKTQNRGSIGLVFLRLFILNLPRRGGNRGTSLPCNFRSFSPVVSPTRRIPSSSFPFPPHPSQQPAAILPFVTLHYLPLRNVEDASFHSGARKISSAVSPAFLGARFMKFGDDLKLLHRSSVLLRRESNRKLRDLIDLI